MYVYVYVYVYIVMNQMDFVQRKNCVCVCVERERESSRLQKIRKLYSKESKIKQQLRREREGAYVVIFSLSSLTSTTSWDINHLRNMGNRTLTFMAH